MSLGKVLKTCRCESAEDGENVAVDSWTLSSIWTLLFTTPNNEVV